MKFELLIVAITIFFIINTYYDGKYITLLKSWKKYYQMAMIGFLGLSLCLFIKRNPSESKNFLNHANQVIKYMPIDKEAGDMISPIINMASNSLHKSSSNIQSNNTQSNYNTYSAPQHKRMLNSGFTTKRSVGETKKKFVASNQGWNCGHCKKQLPAWFEVDHKIRLDNGGSNHVDNLVALCRDCHGKKTALENL